MHCESHGEISYQALRNRAYRLLARREHSAWELRRKLESAQPPSDGARSGVQSAIARLLTELAEQGAQSDFRFAEQLCRWRYQNGRGPLKLQYELSEHQIEESLVKQVMADYDKKWPQLATEVRCRKFGDTPPTCYHEWAKQARFLQQRGFTAEQIGSYID